MNIDHAEWIGDNAVKLCHEDPNEDYIVEAPRGGILWPAGPSPGYLCILAMVREYDEVTKRKPIHVIAEHKIDLVRDIIGTVANETRRLFCRQFYVDIGADRLHLHEELDAHLRRYGFGQIHLDMPYLVEWVDGVLSIQQWMTDGLLDLKHAPILAEQLSMITVEDRDPSRRAPFYAIDALRTVIGSYDEPERPVFRGIKKSGYRYV